MRCPTCGSVQPKDPEARFWWACWPCGLCPRYVCNQPVFTGKQLPNGVRESTPCYVKHLAQQHPHVYEVK